MNNHAQISQYIIQSEEKIRSTESHPLAQNPLQGEWLMWLSKDDFPNKTADRIKLEKVESELHWKQLYEVRRLVEVKFGITKPSETEVLINDVKKKSDKLKGNWFLVISEENLVGEVGLIPFEFGSLKIGRLQDVDIIPSEQGKGFGGEMLREICELAKAQNCDGLALMAKVNDWPKDWYARYGFVKVGETGCK